MRTSLTIGSIVLLASFVAVSAHADERVAAVEPAAAESIPLRATVLHVAPGAAPSERELRIVAVVDAAWTEAALVLRYRSSGAAGAFTDRLFVRSSAGGYHAVIPADVMQAPGVEYFIVGQLMDGSEVMHFASEQRPHRVLVSPTSEARWAEKERRRLSGYISSVSVDVRGHNFGNRYGYRDQYLRGDIDFTHRLLLPRLYAISLGYGMIEGYTPDGVGGGGGTMSVSEGARYGYGAIKVRLRDSVWVDAKAGIGVSDSGFITMVSGAVTFGRPWRSNVSFGAEVIDELGPTFWSRLQWDTAAPFLMGAAIVKTDLPDARLTNGSFIVYDIMYPVTSRLEIRGSLSFGSRDGPGNFGGGLGTALSF